MLSPNWPPLPSAISTGLATFSSPSAIVRSGKYPESLAVGVGQYEESATPMVCASFSRREQARLCAEAQVAKLSCDPVKSQIEVTFNVFAEDPFGFDLVDDPGDVRPQVPGIGFAVSLARLAEGLAWITGRDEMNAAAPGAAVEGCEIVPNKRWSQGRVFHPGHESGRRVGFPLDVTHSPVSGFGDVQSEVEAGVAGAQRNSAKFRIANAGGM